MFVIAPWGLLRADFSYQETIQIAGGPVAKPITYLIKGSRVAVLTKDHIRVIDADRETITEIDFPKKTYSVKTFAQTKESRGDRPEPKFKVSRKDTGQNKPIGVLNASEVVTTMVREDIDSQIVVDSWIAIMPGYEEVKDLQRKLGQKLGYAFSSPPGFEDMFEEVYKELYKVVGVPIEFNVKRGDAAAVAEALQAPPPPAATGVAGALGRLGGIAGLGRKKNAGELTTVSQSSGTLVEARTQISNFSGGPADAAKFEIPAGFKKLEPATAAK
jgi:hypothetical protein